jgi:hypothetical protein
MVDGYPDLDTSSHETKDPTSNECERKFLELSHALTKGLWWDPLPTSGVGQSDAWAQPFAQTGQP